MARFRRRGEGFQRTVIHAHHAGAKGALSRWKYGIVGDQRCCAQQCLCRNMFSRLPENALGWQGAAIAARHEVWNKEHTATWSQYMGLELLSSGSGSTDAQLTWLFCFVCLVVRVVDVLAVFLIEAPIAMWVVTDSAFADISSKDRTGESTPVRDGLKIAMVK